MKKFITFLHHLSKEVKAVCDIFSFFNNKKVPVLKLHSPLTEQIIEPQISCVFNKKRISFSSVFALTHFFIFKIILISKGFPLVQKKYKRQLSWNKSMKTPLQIQLNFFRGKEKTLIYTYRSHKKLSFFGIYTQKRYSIGLVLKHVSFFVLFWFLKIKISTCSVIRRFA